jgi:hypothetical protein
MIGLSKYRSRYSMDPKISALRGIYEITSTLTNAELEADYLELRLRV